MEQNARPLGLDTSEYENLDSEDQTDVASSVFNNRPDEGYNDTSAVQTAFNDAVQAEQEENTAEAVQAVNDANNIDQTQTALESNSEELGLDMTEYNNLTDEEKTYVANDVLNAKGDGYSSASAIETEFNDGVDEAPVDNAQELNDALSLAESGDTITLAGNIDDLGNSLNISQEGITLDAQGYSLNEEISVLASNVTINNITMKASTAYDPNAENTGNHDWAIDVSGSASGFELTASNIEDYYGGVYLNTVGSVSNTTITNSAAGMGIETDVDLADLVGKVSGNTFDTYEVQGIGSMDQGNSEAASSLEDDNTFINGAEGSVKVGVPANN
ncbi:hypothetical protein GLW08_10390 [Pontibacillus yanchengensis]|uniref:Uncharacterized protein n=1 Tax=Pontibacillus yanchengensis TaxID=462910 RepID=A0ACC7VHZ1_9BACI|nr:hypothetical protein [Pontibacillus yanchengensis]MYL53744.1 hypothetical protein [Pontibacillus yanchengensis]